MTFERFARIYLDDHAMLYKRSWKEDERRINKHLLPKYGHKLLTDITKNEIGHLKLAIGRTAKYESNRVLELVSSMFEVAREMELIPELHPNPAKKIKRFEEFPRDEVINDEEMSRLVDAILTLRFRTTQIYYLILILTAFRKQELLSMKWKDVDGTSLHFYVTRDRSKNKKPHALPITPFVQQLLQHLPKDGPYLFPAHYGRTGHLSCIEKSWDAVRERANLRGKRLHDIRRTAGSWLANEDVSAQVIQKLLNHSTIQATQIYMTMKTNRVRHVLTRYEQKLIASGKFLRFLDPPAKLTYKKSA